MYLDEHAAARLRPRTLANYRWTVERHVLPALGKLRLDKVRPEHLTRLYRDKVAAGLSPATVRYVHAVIRAALGLAVSWAGFRGTSRCWSSRRRRLIRRSRR